MFNRKENLILILGEVNRIRQSDLIEDIDSKIFDELLNEELITYDKKD